MENSDDPLIVNGLLTLTLTTAMYRQRGSSSKHASITAMLSYNVVQTVQENENGFCRKSNLAFYISTWIYTVKILFLLFFVFVRHKHPRKRRKAAQQRSVNIALIIIHIRSYYQDKEFQFLFVQKTRKFRSITLFPPPVSRFRNAFIFAFRLVG